MRRTSALLSLLAVIWAAPAFADVYEVSSLAELQARIDRAVPGDTIVMREGVYATSAPITIDRQGTAAAPIRIVAKTIGGVTITGAQGFDVTAPGAHVEIVGFVFTHQAGTTQIRPGATHIRFSRNVFEGEGTGAYLTVAGDDAEIDRNEFRNKKTVGNMIDVRGEGSQVAQRVHIHHNYFHDFENAGGNGAETIRFGLSGLSMSAGHGVIEHNLFVRCMGENELISVKSGSNTLRYNTFLDSRGAQLTLRHGNENLVYGNYLRGTDGIRIFGDRNQVFSNYLEGNTGGINIGNGGAEVADGAPLTSHDRPDDTVIVFNTLVNNRRQYYMTPRTNGLGATNTVFANNIIQGGGVAANLDGQYPGAVWSGNIVWQTDGTGSMPPGTFDAVDPLLVADAGGIFRPRPNSPAIDTATGNHPAAGLDMDGQPRTGRKDRGADETSSEPAVARPLTVEEILGILDAGTAREPQEFLVTDMGELNHAMSRAGPGDVIAMADGEWKDAQILFAANATADRPVVLRARTPGGVRLTGTSYLRFQRPHLVADGLHFVRSEPVHSQDPVVSFESDHGKLLSTVIENFNPPEFATRYHWVRFSGNHNAVERSLFTGKDHQGPVVALAGEARHNAVRYSHFKDIPHVNANGREIIQAAGYGSSEELGDDGGFMTIEYNLFERAHGEGEEIISLKSNRNLVRFNTFRETRGGIVGRSGNYNTIEGNIILGGNQPGTYGIRLSGQYHRVLGNHVADVAGSGLSLHAGEYYVDEQGEIGSLTSAFAPIMRQNTEFGLVPAYGQVKHGLFALNTFVNTGNTAIVVGSAYRSGWPARQRILLPEENWIANNLVANAGSSAAAIHLQEPDSDPPLDRFTFRGNRFEDNRVVGSMAAPTPALGVGSVRAVDIRLERSPEGTYIPADGGEGADGAGRVTPLTTADVGPSWYPPAGN